MADLYFKVRADYEELVRMRKEAEEVKSAMSDFSGSKAEFSELNDRLQKLNEKMQDLAENGAKNFNNMFKDIDLGDTDMFKEYDMAFTKFSASVVSHFDEMKSQYDGMLNELKDKSQVLDEIGGSPKLKAQVDEAIETVERQISVCERAKEIWSGMYDDASVTGLQIVREQIAEEEKKLEILKQQLEAKQEEAEASKMSLGDKVGAFVAGDFDTFRSHKEDVAAVEQATQAYEEQKRVVEGLRGEEEYLQESLSATARAQMEDAEAAQKAAADRQEYIEKLRETQGEASKTSDVLEELLNRGGAASKDLNLDILKNDLTSAEMSLNELGEDLRKTIGDWRVAQRELTNMETEMMSDKGSKLDPEDIEAARAKVAELREGVIETANAYDRTNADVQTLKQQLDEASGHQVTMRTQMRQAREELARMIADGRAGTPEFQKMAQEAGKLSRQFKLASASMQYFANPTRHLAALKTGLQGVAGATGLVTGAMGLFNSESKKAQEIQTKIQSVLGIIVGLESAYNMVKKTSTLMLALEEVKTMGVAAARQAETVATEEATVAQEELNVAMSANPIGAVVAVIGTLIAALAALTMGIYEVYKANSEEYQLEQERKEMMERQTQAQEEFRKTVSRSVGEQISKYNALKNEWNSLRTNQERNKFIKDNAKKFHDLGYAVDSVSEAEHFFDTTGTKNFVAACTARAKAMAYMALASKEYERAIEAEMKLDNAARMKQLLEAAGNINKDANALERFFNLRDQIYHQAEKERAQNSRIYNEAMAKGDEYMKNMGKEAKEAERLSALVGRLYDPNAKNPKKKKEKKEKEKKAQVNHEQADKDDKEYEHQEELRKRAVEAEKKSLQDSIKNISDANKKRELQHKLALIEAKEYYRNMIMQEVAYKKAEYDEKHEGTNNKVSYYKTKEFQDLMLESKDKYIKEMKELNLEAYENEIEVVALLSGLQDAMARKEGFDKSIKNLDQFFSARVKIEKEYLAKEQSIKDAIKNGAIDEKGGKELIEELEKQKKAALEKESFTNFKNSPLLQVAMADSYMDYSKLDEVRTQITDMLNKAMDSAEPSDFKGILDSYVKITDMMIEKDPFGEMKRSAEELKTTTEELEHEQEELDDLYKELGTNAKGEETGELARLHSEADKATDKMREADEAVKQATNAREEALIRFNESTANGASEEEQIRLKNELASAIATEEATLKEAESAMVDYNNTQQAYASAKGKVAKQEDRVKKAAQQQTAAQNRNNKATKSSVKLVGEWANALKEAAGMFQSPIASAVSGMADLTMTTLNSIDAIKKAGEGSAKGVAKVAQAVNKAVAILAIIQAAWEVINTIMSLFKGKDEEEYHKRIDALHGKVKALDYTFNLLKEDMDDAWGTEAIDAYTRAVDVLNEKQAASLELIKAQSNAHYGHHSLAYYQRKESGITSKELAEAKKKIKELGGDVTGDWITDWLYTLTAEQLREFMTSGIGTLVMGKLGGVAGTGDYSGSEWFSDMQAYADTAKTLEDLTIEMATKMNGISLDGLKDEFKSLVTTFTTSFNDINNSFDAFMREGIYNKMRTGWESEVEKFYDDLSKLKEKFDKGEISDEEFRREVQALRNRYQEEVKRAQNEYQSTLTASGINVTDVEQSATSGGFESMSEDTGTELNGRFAAMQAQETLTAEGVLQSVGIQTNILNVADEIRTMQVNSYLELQAISENTKKIYNTMGEMQTNIKSIKENTDKL